MQTYRSVPGQRPLPGKRPCICFGSSNGKRPLPGKRPGNVSQLDDEADAWTRHEDIDNGDVDDLDPSSDADAGVVQPYAARAQN